MCKVINGVRIGSRVTKKINKYIYKNCENFYEKKVEDFYKKFKLKLILAGREEGNKIAIKKCQSIILMLLDTGFVQDFLLQESLFEFSYLGDESLRYHNSVKRMVDDNFLVSRYFDEKSSKNLFNIYSIQNSLKKIEEYWKDSPLQN